MSVGTLALKQLARRTLSGKGAHVETRSVFLGLDWKAAGAKPRRTSHSVYQLLNHVSYWQDWVVQWLDGHEPVVPRHASGGWPGEVGPSGRREWEDAVRRFQQGLTVLERSCGAVELSSTRGRKRLEMLRAIGAHNSYHAGQVVLLRQQLGKWPSSRGLTW